MTHHHGNHRCHGNQPTFRTVDIAVFRVEFTGSDWLTAVAAQEAVRVESVLDGVYYLLR